jgi:predicted RNA-binding Zn-ribbon protein involved in translation (DUF1610 family)
MLAFYEAASGRPCWEINAANCPHLMDLKTPCHHCGQNIAFPDTAIGLQTNCPHCGQTTTLAAQPPASPPPLPRVQVRKSTSGAIKGNTLTLAGTVYNLSQINSVRVAEPGTTGDAVGAIIFGMFSGAMLLNAVEAKGNSAGISVFWSLAFGLLTLWLFFRVQSKRKQLTLFLRTSSGESEACVGNRYEVQALAAEITAAIATR